jgi:hypothetical protein
MSCWLIWGIWQGASFEIVGAAAQPIAGKPVPTGSLQALNTVEILWKLACPQWAAERPQKLRQSAFPA